MTWAVVCLGVIASATLATAIAQVMAIVALVRSMNRVRRMTANVSEDVRPLGLYFDQIARDGARMVSVASVSAARVNHRVQHVHLRVNQVVQLADQLASLPRRARGAVAQAAFGALARRGSPIPHPANIGAIRVAPPVAAPW